MQLEEEVENWARETKTLTEIELEYKLKEEEFRKEKRSLE